MHEALLRRIVLKEQEFDAAGWEPGLCSNGWKVLYVGLCLAAIGFSVGGIGAMYHFMSGCPLNQFFLSETLLIGAIFAVASMFGSASKGLLPPALLWAYNTYLCFGAITNNPDVVCNALASTDSGSKCHRAAAMLRVFCVHLLRNAHCTHLHYTRRFYSACALLNAQTPRA